MSALVGRRVEVRLDEDHRAKLAEVVQARGGTVSDFLREEIDREHALLLQARVREMARRLRETATWTPSNEEISTILNESRCDDVTADE